jgi:hypothetical protein
MTKPSVITKWLMQPADFSETDRKDAAALIKTYPYFVPARYIEAGEHHKKQPFAPAMLNMMQLYRGNWLLFHDFLGATVSSESVVYEEEVIPQGDEAVITEDTSVESTEDVEYPDEVLYEEPFGTYKDEEIAALSEDFDDEDVVSIEIENDYGIEEEASAPLLEKTLAPQQEEIKPTIIKETPPVPEVVMIPPIPSLEETTTNENEKRKGDEQIPFYQNRKADSLIQPIYTEDYFLHQGLQVSDELPPDIDRQKEEVDKSLMVVMSFSEWLLHFKTKGERAKEEQEDQKALKTMWQKEKLAAALEEENDEIPETVFEMAVNSIAKEEDLASESLAEIMVKQGKPDKAIEMYRKLSLRNPQKKTYFARKIDEVQKEKES